MSTDPDPDSIAKRDQWGRLQIAGPEAPEDAVNKGYLENAIGDSVVGVLSTEKLLHIEYRTTGATNGDPIHNGAWRTRSLNTVVQDKIDGATLSNDQITLPAGNYWVKATPQLIFDGDNGGDHVARLQQVSNGGVTLLHGQHQHTRRGETLTSLIEGQIALADTENLEVQHRCDGGGNSRDGVGAVISNAWNDHNVITQVYIWKLGNE